MLIDTPERLQRVAIQDFVNRELAELRREASTPAVVTGSNVIKLDVSSYIGEGPKRLALNRWLCEVHIAVQARQLSMEFTRTHFLLSKLTGTAKECALGKLVANSGCFPDMQALTDDLRLALEPPQDKHHHRSAFFEPPQDKHHHRSAFFALRQGSKIHSTRATSGIVYIRLPYRHGDTSLCVRDRDECWVSAFLLKAKISSHEEAFSIALREDYSVLASQVGHSLPLRAAQEPEPIEIDAIGPAAAFCRAPAPLIAVAKSGVSVSLTGQPKNGENQ
ncbi:unnamed protein product [Peronospora farinosa]|uniref:Uncharacterized protein n=1 Tax=Peronospora farinosa TaxID=134698 RepID=A0AAV0T4M9_9STRA|nr:unnamed protein product [Peronospora farinosa]